MDVCGQEGRGLKCTLWTAPNLSLKKAYVQSSPRICQISFIFQTLVGAYLIAVIDIICSHFSHLLHFQIIKTAYLQLSRF